MLTSRSHFFIVYQEMRKLKRWIIDNKNHEKCNTFLLTIICHGNKQGHLLDKNKSKAWDTEEFIGDLCEVEALTGKPKILTIQCCRGCKNFPTVIFLRCLGGHCELQARKCLRTRPLLEGVNVMVSCWSSSYDSCTNSKRPRFDPPLRR